MKFEQLANKQIGIVDEKLDLDLGLITYYYQHKEWRFSTIYMDSYTSKQLKKIAKKLKELNDEV